MSPIHYLALAPDLQSLQDILNSLLNHEEIILLLPHDLAEKQSLHLGKIGNLIKVKNYLNSGEVETIAYTQFQKTPYQRIIATHEIDILRAARLRELLHLPGQHYKSAIGFRQKTVMKTILHQQGVKGIPAFKVVKSPADVIDFMNTHPFPLVIKPDLSTGSEGITILHTPEQVFSYLQETSLFQANQPIDMQIEAFIDGTMYHINGYVQDGKLTSCWPCVYPHQSIGITMGKHASSYLLPHTNPLVPRLNRYAQAILTALPTPKETPFHLEVFINQADEIIFCEIASRIGGKGIRQAWEESFGIPLSKMFVHSQAGLTPNFSPPVFPDKPFCLTGEIWFPTQPGRLEKIEQECPFPWVEDYQTFYKAGDVIQKKVKNINECLCGIPLLIADTEPEMQQRLEIIVEWIQATTKWSPL